MRFYRDVVIFADDAAVFYRDKTWAALKQKIENDFGNIIFFYIVHLIWKK